MGAHGVLSLDLSEPPFLGLLRTISFYRSFKEVGSLGSNYVGLTR